MAKSVESRFRPPAFVFGVLAFSGAVGRVGAQTPPANPAPAAVPASSTSAPGVPVGDAKPPIEGAGKASEAGAKAAEPGPLLQIKTPLMRSLTIGGRFRLRGEWRDPADYRVPGTFGRPATDDPDGDTDMVLMRTRLYFDVDVIDPVRVYVEMQDSRQWGDEPSTVADTADLSLKQGYVEFRKVLGAPLSVRAGRMELPALGDQRLISPLDWHNVGRSWDGVHATWTPADWVVHGIATNLKEANLTGGDAGDDHWFGGLYASYRGMKDHELDAYVFHRSLSDRTFAAEVGGRKGERWDLTPGFRAKGKCGAWDYGGEVMGQFGSQAGDPVRAWAGAATLGCTFDIAWKPRVGVEYDYASGDRDPTDHEFNTFDPLLPFNHAYQGHGDFVGWRNLHDAMVSVRVAPCGTLTVNLDAHAFRLAESRDAWYGDPPGVTIRRDKTGGSGRDLGESIDLYAKWKWWDRVAFWTGYSHFFPGSYVDRTGIAPDGNWVFLQMEVYF